MRIHVRSGRRAGGDDAVMGTPGDKSIAHRWLILAATATGPSRLAHLPPSLDVRSTASCLSRVTVKARPALDLWASNASSWVEGGGSTWNETSREGPREPSTRPLEVEGEGRATLVESRTDLDCGNSGTSMRLLAGLLSSAPFSCRLVGDTSLSARPMERVAEPLRRMGARIDTTEGHPPLLVSGGSLHGIEHLLEVPTAQVKGALLLAGLAADGETLVTEPVATRDHTERALAALGAPVRREGTTVGVTRFQHEGFDGSVPGDVSSAAFLIGAAALGGRALSIEGVGLNPSRTRYLDVLTRMGVRTETVITDEQLGEPVGRIELRAEAELHGTTIDEGELPLVIDEVPLLAVLAAHAEGETWFLGAHELRLKETDRLTRIAEGIRSLGGHAAAEADDLVIAGGGLRGGVASSGGDHRLAMAFAVAGVGAEGVCEVRGVEAAEVSFPGFVEALREAGASVEVVE
jgi:3-phosphoshikimate 1-carboxyvinyltransferase